MLRVNRISRDSKIWGELIYLFTLCHNILVMSKKIMIVDDAEYMREMLEEIIDAYGASEGYKIVGIATDGKEAIAKYRELAESGQRPDIVTMDIVMPNMDGIAVTKELRKYDPNVKVLAISALGSPDTIDRVMQAGARDYIIKPFSVDALMDMIHRISAPVAGRVEKKAKTQAFAKENVIPGVVASSDDGCVVVTVKDAAIEAISDYGIDSRVMLHISPENIELQKQNHHDSTKNLLKGSVVDIIRSNPIAQVKLDCGFELAANVPSKALDGMHLSVGNRVYATFNTLAVQVKR